MTDKPGNNQEKPEPSQTPGQGIEGGAPEPTYITRTDLEGMLGAFKQEIGQQLNNTYRGIQSMTQKVKPQLDQLDQAVQRLQAAGLEVSPDAVQRAKTEILTQAYSQQDTEPPPQGATPPGQGAPQTTGEFDIDSLAARFDEAFGVHLVDEDPEVASIPNINDVGEAAFVTAVRNAYIAKVNRLNSDTPHRAAARSTLIGANGLPSSNPIENIKDPETLWNMAMKNYNRG